MSADSALPIAKRPPGKGGGLGKGRAPEKRTLLVWGSAERTLAGESVIGDRALVHVSDQVALAAVIDGLGHGAQAARAAEIAVRVLVDHRAEPPVALFARCDAALEATRGVVMSLALFDAARDVVTWAGVGDVEGVLLRWNTTFRRETEVLLRRVGVVGTKRDQSVYAETMSLEVGDTLILATDGVRAGFELGLRLDDPPQRIADQILAESASALDDALVLVARYLGRAGVPPSGAPSPRSGIGSGAWHRIVVGP